MQTSNRDNPIENNINDMIHSIEKISIRLPIALNKENYTLTTTEIEQLKLSCNNLLSLFAEGE